jgi:hypothetical protein
MKTTFPAVALLATANAQYYNITSKPFQLVLTSSTDSINGTLSACHTGAALESLCVLPSNTSATPEPTYYNTFNFNTSSFSEAPPSNASLGAPGILTWDLPTNNANVPSSVYFSYDPSTNSAIPIFSPGSDSPQILAFDSGGELIVQGYVDWTADPPTGGDVYGLKRWYVCKTYFSGYQYTNLVWGLGAAKPENPTCVAVGVKRVFV